MYNNIRNNNNNIYTVIYSIYFIITIYNIVLCKKRYILNIQVQSKEFMNKYTCTMTCQI